MTEQEKIAQAVVEGYPDVDQTCSACQRIFKNYHHFIRCDNRPCPMSDGKGTLMEQLVELGKQKPGGGMNARAWMDRLSTAGRILAEEVIRPIADIPEYDADCPACLRGRAHTRKEHDEKLRHAHTEPGQQP